MASKEPRQIDEQLLKRLKEAFEDEYGVTLDQVVEDLYRIDENVIGLYSREERRNERLQSVHQELAEFDDRLASLEMSISNRADGKNQCVEEGEDRGSE